MTKRKKQKREIENLLRRFATNANRCAKEKWISSGDIDIGRYMMLKDLVYLLGVSVDDNKYKWSSGFQRFCRRYGFKLDKEQK